MCKISLLAAVVLFSGFLAVESASCTTYKDTFSVTVNSGPWSSSTPYTGSFTWDTKNPNSLTFTSDFPIWSAGEQLGEVWHPTSLTDPTLGSAPWEIYLDPLPGPGVNFFLLSGIGPDGGTLIYGTKGGQTWTIEPVLFVDPPVSSPAPEPATFWLMALGVIGMLGMVRYRKSVRA